MSIDNKCVFSIKNDVDFNELALQIFLYQYNNNHIYKKFVDLIHKDISKIKHYSHIPFLPIDFFKNHLISTYSKQPLSYFESSGSGGFKSKHYYISLDVYERSFEKCFERFYGKPEKYSFLALLPAYADNPHSSLIYMVNSLIKKSTCRFSGFYHNNEENLFEVLQKLKKENKAVILLGVSFALLDFCKKYKIDFSELIVIETGGMKGRRKEIIRDDLHEILKHAFGVNQIHSEYGMTELFSQAYSKAKGIFVPPTWMKVFIREINDPLNINKKGSGAINIIDLANMNSCSFIATDDIGTVLPNGKFMISGRLDNSQMRGCSMLTLD